MEQFVTLMFGGNIGDSAALFDFAAGVLTDNGFYGLKRSEIFVTSPVDCVPGTPDFFNQAAAGYWCGSARELLTLTQHIEREAGRPEIHSSREARTLDIDIITFGMQIIREKDLIIPHPRALQRRFVLEPLFTIVPDLLFPDCRKKLSDLL